MQITQFEVHNHETDKSDEVRIAVLNSTLPNSLDDDLHVIIPLAYNSLTALLLKSPPGGACDNYPAYRHAHREPEGYLLSALNMGDKRRVLVARTRKTGTDESHRTIDFGLAYKDGARLLILGQGINSRARNTVIGRSAIMGRNSLRNVYNCLVSTWRMER